MGEITFSKISRIYQITNTVNNKIYIGHSININFRWYVHLDNLLKGIHPNYKLQEDFNTYGLSAFNFRILELLDGKENLINKEQEYLNNLNFDSNYNIYNSSRRLTEIKQNVSEFLKYIKTKWVIPDISKDLEQYRIYKTKDKNEILKKAKEDWEFLKNAQ